MNQYYPHLFQPVKVNSMMLKNRIISSIMGIPKSHELLSSVHYGNVSIIDKSTGGAAMNFVSIESAADDNAEFPKHDRDGIRESISVARQYGAKVGTWCVPRLKRDAAADIRAHYDGRQVLAPSAYLTRSGEQAIELSKEDIAGIMKQAQNDALAIKKFGFDFVYLYLGYEELTTQFLSPAFNERTDEYGGTLENRMRFAIEHVSAVREAVGVEYPIVVLVAASDYINGSYTFEEMLALLEQLKDKVDLINISAGMDMIPGYFPDKGTINPELGLEAWYRVNGKHCQSIYEPRLTNLDWARKIKKRFPEKLVSVVGSVLTPEDAERIIADGSVDAVTMGRALNADPYLPRKALEGRGEDIVPCIRCLYCYHSATEHTNVQCSVNPRYRRENRVPLKLEKADRIKKVVVVGGGPAGCRAALTAAEKGHEVTLIEKKDSLGGQLQLARFERHKKELTAYRDYLDLQVRKSNIKLICNRSADKELIQQLKPEILLLALGASPARPTIKGISLPNVSYFDDIYPKLDTLGKHVCVVGGGLVGVELAVELLERGKEVTLIEMGAKIAAQAHIFYKAGLRNFLEKFKEHLQVELNTRCVELLIDGIVVNNSVRGDYTISCDNTIIAAGMRANRDEAFGLYGIADETMMFGDCENVGQVIQATNDAYFIASNI